MVGIGVLLCAYSFAKQPKLGYVLPFRVHRLIAADNRSGVPLFTFTWDEKGLAETTLFAGAMQGVSGILNESLHQGTVQEIKFERGFLLLHQLQEIPVTFILIATKSSQILKQGLGMFAENFAATFKSNLKTENNCGSGTFRLRQPIDSEFISICGILSLTSDTKMYFSFFALS